MVVELVAVVFGAVASSINRIFSSPVTTTNARTKNSIFNVVFQWCFSVVAVGLMGDGGEGWFSGERARFGVWWR